MRVIVAKLGGSLLLYPRLREVWCRWCSDYSQGAHVLVIAGGGRWAEAIRQLDRELDLGESAAHWLCIDAMTLTARIVSEILPDARFVDDVDIQQFAQPHHGGEPPPGPTVLDVAPFLRHGESSCESDRLPHSWMVTSDSIAARIAQLLNCQLALLKSADPPGHSLADWSAQGYVDPHFPTIAQHLTSVRAFNLRKS